jgi:hypothetical protein
MALSAHARRIGARVLTLGGIQECGDTFIDCNPFELLAYFRDAVAVVTDTFHGTIFSIVSKRPFATIIRSSTGSTYGNEEKLGFLLETSKLESRQLDGPDAVEQVLSTPFETHGIDEKLVAERARTRKYLAENVLGPGDTETR